MFVAPKSCLPTHAYPLYTAQNHNHLPSLPLCQQPMPDDLCQMQKQIQPYNSTSTAKIKTPLPNIEPPMPDTSPSPIRKPIISKAKHHHHKHLITPHLG